MYRSCRSLLCSQVLNGLHYFLFHLLQTMYLDLKLFLFYIFFTCHILPWVAAEGHISIRSVKKRFSTFWVFNLFYSMGCLCNSALMGMQILVVSIFILQCDRFIRIFLRAFKEYILKYESNVQHIILYCLLCSSVKNLSPILEPRGKVKWKT